MYYFKIFASLSYHTLLATVLNIFLGYIKPPVEQTRLIYFLFPLKQIDNLGFKEVPVNVSLTIPTQLEHSFEMFNYSVTVEQVWWCLLPLSWPIMPPQVSQWMITIYLLFQKNKTQCKNEARVNSKVKY